MGPETEPFTHQRKVQNMDKTTTLGLTTFDVYLFEGNKKSLKIPKR
jgi:hypothetical protein